MAGILAIDLGKIKSVSFHLEAQASDGVRDTSDGVRDTSDGVFDTHDTSPAVFHDLLVRIAPEVVVIEVGSLAGWVCDLCRAMKIKVVVANTNDPLWQWRQVKRKTDRDDARRLAELQRAGRLPEVHVPQRQVRQWRSLIEYRAQLVRRRTAIRNTMHAILAREGMSLAGGGRNWTLKRIEQLKKQARPMSQCDGQELWRGMLDLELKALAAIAEQIGQVEEKLNALGAASEKVKLLRTIPGVGPRLSELIVAVIDDPARFKNRRQVGSYAGLVPRQYESGQSSRSGRITGRGNPLLRALLVEVSWLMRRYNRHFAGVFEQVSHGSKSRRKTAAVATSRRLLITCWAMLRDNQPWKEKSKAA